MITEWAYTHRLLSIRRHPRSLDSVVGQSCICLRASPRPCSKLPSAGIIIRRSTGQQSAVALGSPALRRFARMKNPFQISLNILPALTGHREEKSANALGFASAARFSINAESISWSDRRQPCFAGRSFAKSLRASTKVRIERYPGAATLWPGSRTPKATVSAISVIPCTADRILRLNWECFLTAFSFFIFSFLSRISFS